ncbi:cardiolipin synthase [Faecalispora anaeroviscerum]|uniref:cardiolipin synthase n=1 Tax=Faecalispora anaeroviscerum TaxID=2991836 RepID=UPI0024B88182|nr:cardiolipin synthase [Faecalispora anaeroviscerum]
MKKALKSLLSRTSMIALAILVQIAVLLVMITQFSNYYVWFYSVCYVISIVVTLWILNNSDLNPTYKLAWSVAILLFPIFGGMFYLMFGRSRHNRVIRRSVSLENQSFRAYLKPDPEILEEITAQNPDAGAQVRYLQRYSNCPVCRNGSAVYFPSGESKFRTLVEELKKAEHFIFLEYFIIREGVMWNTVLEILAQKARQGVEVRVLYDDMGCLFTLPFKYSRRLERMGIQCSVFNSFVPFLSTLMNNRDHRKIVVIDGKVAFTGGVNLADEYINLSPRFGQWKDAAIMIRGDAVWNFTVMFLSLWGFERKITEDYEKFRVPQEPGEPQEGGYVLPYSDNPLDWEPVGRNVYLNLIGRAKKYLYINTPYLIPDNEVLTALCNAAKSGVDVRIITPHIPDKKLVYMVTRANYEVLVKNGVKIYEFIPGFNHAKTVVCDDEYGIVGTINFDYRSFYMHFECAAWMFRCPAIGSMRDEYLLSLSQCRQVVHAECRSNRWFVRALNSVLNLFAPLM